MIVLSHSLKINKIFVDFIFITNICTDFLFTLWYLFNETPPWLAAAFWLDLRQPEELKREMQNKLYTLQCHLLKWNQIRFHFRSAMFKLFCFCGESLVRTRCHLPNYRKFLLPTDLSDLPFGSGQSVRNQPHNKWLSSRVIGKTKRAFQGDSTEIITMI